MLPCRMNWTLHLKPFPRAQLSVCPPLRVLFPALDVRPSDLSTCRRSGVTPLFATHTDFAPATPVFATHTKTTGVYTNSSRFGTQLPSLTAIPSSHDKKLVTINPLESASRIRSGMRTLSNHRESKGSPPIPVPASIPSHSERPVTASSLECVFTKCDVRKPLGMCIYENCRVSLLFLAKNLKSYLNFPCAQTSGPISRPSDVPATSCPPVPNRTDQCSLSYAYNLCAILASLRPEDRSVPPSWRSS
jgi:hypothetical protein